MITAKSIMWEIPSKIIDRNGEIIGRSYEENRSLVTIEQMPSVLVNALLAQEDQRFYEHKGVDLSLIHI